MIIMDLVVTSVNGVIKAGILSESLLGAEDSHMKLEEVKNWERKYVAFVEEGKKRLSSVKNQSELDSKWSIGDLISTFLDDNKNVNLIDWDKSIARDMDIKPTEKRKEGYGDSDIKALVNLRKIFKSHESIDNRISWELLYFTNQIIINYLNKKKLNSLALSKNKLTNEILELANQEAKFAVKGNSGHAISVTKKLMESILNSLL
jgi:hypothetical protein